jgi:hypothetical protein
LYHHLLHVDSTPVRQRTLHEVQYGTLRHHRRARWRCGWRATAPVNYAAFAVVG